MASVSPRFWFCMEWKPQKSDYYVCISIVIVIFVIFPFKFYTRIKINVCTTAILIVLLYSVWEKAMAPHSSTVARKIPWMEEPGGLQSMGSLRVRHYWVTSLSLSTFMHWRRKWQPTPVFLPGKSHGQRSLVGCSPWGHTESDTTEVTWQQYSVCLYICLYLLAL